MAFSHTGDRVSADRVYPAGIGPSDDGIWSSHRLLRKHPGWLDELALIRIQPANAMAHVNIGVALARQDRFDDALAQFEEALRIDLRNPMARVYRDRILAAKNAGR